MKYSKYNVIIMGSGLAGLYLACRLSKCENFPDGILIITKGDLYSGSTSLAQGGIVSVIPEINHVDSNESHIKDTIVAGCGLNDINTVKFVSEYSSVVTQELIRMGVEFDKNSNNMLNFTMEGAHSCPRILHANGDSTGSVIEKALCNYLSECNNVDIYTNTIGVEILCDSNNIARGIIALRDDTGAYEVIYSNNIVLATGGIGQVYKYTTNPETSTGDGIALAYRAGAIVQNMEFVQFHPTGLHCKNKKVVPLVSESVRGEGAKLVNLQGEYFAKNYHSNADLAPRDIVSRAIQNEMKKTSSEYVNLDISQIGIENFKRRFPTITGLCKENQIDINTGLIPVAPVQHYFMGGIKTDLQAKTSLENLYAIGECAMTGLHGANRLASNSLLECAVFAHSLAEYISKNTQMPPDKHDKKIQNAVDKLDGITANKNELSEIENLFEELKEIMSKSAAISRNKEEMTNALIQISKLEKSINMDINTFCTRKYELLNAICISKLILNASIERDFSIGAHFRSDISDKTNTETPTKYGKSIDNELLVR